MSNTALKHLHTALIDAGTAYDTAIERAETEELKSLFRDVQKLHGTAHADLHQVLVAKGERPDDDGSFMSTVHKVAITARSAITGIDEGSLSAFRSGEERLVEAYDRAIDEQKGTDAVARLREHRNSLSAAIDRMAALEE